MKTKKYQLTELGTLNIPDMKTLDGRTVPGLLRVASVPNKVASRAKWEKVLAALPSGKARHNTSGGSSEVRIYPVADLSALGVPHNPAAYIHA